MGVRERLDQMRAQGVTDEEAIFTLAHEGLMDPKLAEQMIRESYASAPTPAPAKPSRDTIREAIFDKVPMDHEVEQILGLNEPKGAFAEELAMLAGGPRPEMPKSFPPSGPAGGGGGQARAQMPPSYEPSGPSTPGLEFAPGEDQRAAQKRALLVALMRSRRG